MQKHKSLALGLLVLKGIFIFPIASVFAVVFVLGIILAYVPVLIICMCYKAVVTFFSICVKKDSKMLHGLDNLLAHGEIYTDKSMYVTLNLIFEGKIELEKYIQDWDEKAIKLKNPDGKLKYPELQCYVDTWMGYSFYTQDKTFDLRNHIRVYDNNNEVVDRKKFNKIRNEQINTLFPRKRSPWEVLIIHNYKKDDIDDGKEYTIIAFKYHHCLADGYSTLLLLFGMCGHDVSKLGILSSKKKLNCLQKMFIYIASFFHGLFLLGQMPFYMIYSPNEIYDANSWHKPIKPKDLDLVLWSLKPFETDTVKEISAANKVNVTSVLLTASVGAFRRMMEARGLKSPKEIYTGMSLNLPNPPERLGTHSFAMRFDIPISGKSAKERLMATSKRLNSFARITLLVVAPIVSYMLEYLPTSFKVKTKKSSLFVTTSFTSVPLPSIDVVLEDGCKLVETYHNFEMTHANATFIVTILKYKSQFFVTYGIQRKILNNEEEVYAIEEHLMEELKSLKGESLTA